MTKTTGEPHDSTSPDQGYEVARRRINEAAQGDGPFLDLSWLNLVSLPPEIGRLTALTMLLLRGNPLAALPPGIGRLTALTTLNLGNNQLQSLPPEVGRLTALTQLYLHDN